MKVHDRFRMMPQAEHAPERHDMIVFLERFLFFAVIILKADVFLLERGQMIGFDAQSFIQTVDYIIAQGTVPPISLNASAMHPPLSFLLTVAIAFPLQNIVVASQVVSSLSMLVVFLCLRFLLKHIGLLWSIPGFLLLYLTSALPMVIFLGTETTYDSLVFAWAMLALLASVQLFWNPLEEENSFRRISSAILLVLSISGGMLTKSTGLLFAAFPFCVLLSRSRRDNLSRDVRTAIFLCTTALVLVFPSYYQRYYRETGKLLPHAMEWNIPGELAEERAERDAHPFSVLWQILHVPASALQWNRAHPEYSSFPDTVWFQTWKRDTYNVLAGPVSLFAREVSNFYIFFFSIPLFAGTALFLFKRNINSTLRELGLLLFLTTILFSLSCIAFGYHYPVWSYVVFKTKYVPLVVLWFPFCTAYCADLLLAGAHTHPRTYRAMQYASISFTVVFVFVNHLLIY